MLKRQGPFGPRRIRRDPFRPRRGFISGRFYGISKVNLVRKFGIDPIKKPFPLGGFHRPPPPVCRHLASYFLHEENIFRDKFALNPVKYENTDLLSPSDCFSLVSAAPHPPDGKDLYNCNYASLMICLPPPQLINLPACSCQTHLPQPAARLLAAPARFRVSAVVVTSVNFEPDCSRAWPRICFTIFFENFVGVHPAVIS